MENSGTDRAVGALALPDEAIADLELFATVHASQSAIESLRASIAAAAGLKEAAHCVGEALSVTPGDAQHLVRAILSLHTLRRSLRLSPPDLVERVGDAFRKNRPSLIAEWKQVALLLTPLLAADHPFAGLEKALRLAYEYQNVATKLQLLTDVRPVFSDNASAIERNVVAFVLRVEYHDGAHSHAIDLALDSLDVRELRRLCERAEAKATTLQKQLTAPTTLAGELDR